MLAKIVYHVFEESQYPNAAPIINSISKLNTKQEHCILLSGSENYQEFYKHLNDKVSISFLSNKELLLFILKNSKDPNTFIMHGFNHAMLILNFMIFWKRYYFYWICWGSGVNKRKGIKGLLSNFLKKALYSRIDRINVLMTPDKEKMLSIVGANKDVRCIRYSVNIGQRSFKNTNVDDLHILVGHRASFDLNHIELLNSLSKLENKRTFNISLLLNYPVNIDRDDYKKSIINTAHKLFEDKVTVYEKHMDIESYTRLVSQIDVLIVDTIQQAALGAIYKVLESGGTIYLNQNSQNAKWLDSLGIKYLTTNQIYKKESSLELLNNEEKENNYQNYKKISYDNSIEWVDFYEN